jgi:hypothetical protein
MEIFNPIRPNLNDGMHLRVYCHGGCGLAKASKDPLYPVGDEKQTYTRDDALSFLFEWWWI